MVRIFIEVALSYRPFRNLCSLYVYLCYKPYVVYSDGVSLQIEYEIRFEEDQKLRPSLRLILKPTLIPCLYSPLGATVYQPSAGRIFTCPQTEVKDHPASLRVTCGEHVEPPRCRFSRTRITATNQWLSKFLTMMDWHPSILPGIVPVIAPRETH